MNAKLKTKKPYDSVKKAIIQVRLDHILSVARDVFVREGYEKLTMRKVASEAGIAVSHLHHYFSTKDILLRDMFEFVSDAYITQYNVILDNLSFEQPDKMLSAIIEYLLSSRLDSNIGMFLIEFWALSLRNVDAKIEIDKVHAHHRKILIKYLVQINPKMNKDLCDLRSIQMAAMLDGLIIHAAHMKPNSKKYKRLIKDAHENIMRLATG